MTSFARISAKVLLLLATSALIACGQGTFQNLNFELANVPNVPPGDYGANVSSLNGVPFWVTYIGTNQVTSILHNNLSLSDAGIAILGPTWSFGTILEGQYSVQLQGSSPDGSVLPSIAQMGTVPADAQSLRFYGSSGVYSVSFGGQQIPLEGLGVTSTYTIYGVDISGFNSQSGNCASAGAAF